MGLEIDYIFHPKSIAVAGASANKDKSGYRFFKSLLDLGYEGALYPVNNKGDEILEHKVYSRVQDIPGPVDYVISCVPNNAALDLVDDCAVKGVKVIHFFTARFSETGHEDGAAMESKLLERARQSDIRLIGPNCMGLYYPKEKISFDSSFAREVGTVGILSQSGGNAMEISHGAAERGVRFSKVLSYGNALDLNEADLLEYLADDPETKVIGGYIEGVRAGPRFVKALQYATQRKPVILLKGGKTTAGTGAVSSHTASLAGSREIWKAMCEQTGAISADDMDDLLDLLVGFNFLSDTTGFNVMVSGGGGGSSVLSADECEEEGLFPVPLPEETRTKLIEMHPFFGPWISNPLDMSILGGSGLTIYSLLETMAESSVYDTVIVSSSDRMPRRRSDTDTSDPVENALKAMDHNLEISRKTGKPLAVVKRDGIPDSEEHLRIQQAVQKHIIDEGFPIFPTMRRAARTLQRVTTYHLNQRTSES